MCLRCIICVLGWLQLQLLYIPSIIVEDQAPHFNRLPERRIHRSLWVLESGMRRQVRNALRSLEVLAVIVKALDEHAPDRSQASAAAINLAEDATDFSGSMSL